MFEIPTSTASEVLANVSSLFSDPGLLTIVALAAAVPLTFYVIRSVIGLFPKHRAK